MACHDSGLYLPTKSHRCRPTAMQDLRYALRTLMRQRAFSAVAIFTVAIGIGANTAIYSVVDATLLRPLPFYEPDRQLLPIAQDSGCRGPHLKEEDSVLVRDMVAIISYGLWQRLWSAKTTPL